MTRALCYVNQKLTTMEHWNIRFNKRVLFVICLLGFCATNIVASIKVSVDYKRYGSTPGKIVIEAFGSASPYTATILQKDGQVASLPEHPPLFVVGSYEWLCTNLADKYWLVGTAYEQGGDIKSRLLSDLPIDINCN